ncbi:hypothetical protein KUCAC02_032800 [Chaenocephalus aceratus]|nr:hypothetical protein KUCAC02_032800 [Chaenocephalus aceratus]
MIGREKGAVQRLKEHHPELLSHHCIIHQSVLCANLGKEYSDVMETSQCSNDDILLHNNVRWLSKGIAPLGYTFNMGKVLAPYKKRDDGLTTSAAKTCSLALLIHVGLPVLI